MIDLDKLDYAELFTLHQKAAEKLGFFHMVTISVADIAEHCEQLHADGEINQVPDEKIIRQACADVWRKYDAEDWTHTVDWITEVIDDIIEEVQL